MSDQTIECRLCGRRFSQLGSHLSRIHDIGVSYYSKNHDQLQPRILAKVAKEPNGCWIWNGATSNDGYGMVVSYGRTWRAHRFSWWAFTGKKLMRGRGALRHTCDHPLCVNPEHLIPGTHQANTLDAVAKGRHPAGENHGRSLLTEAQVLELRTGVASGQTRQQYAQKFGVPARIIAGAVRGDTYKYIGGPRIRMKRGDGFKGYRHTAKTKQRLREIALERAKARGEHRVSHKV